MECRAAESSQDSPASQNSGSYDKQNPCWSVDSLVDGGVGGGGCDAGAKVVVGRTVMRLDGKYDRCARAYQVFWFPGGGAGADAGHCCGPDCWSIGSQRGG